MDGLNDKTIGQTDGFVAETKNRTAKQIYYYESECLEMSGGKQKDRYDKTTDIIHVELDKIKTDEVGNDRSSSETLLSDEGSASKNNNIRTVYMNKSGASAELLGKTSDSETKDLNQNNQVSLIQSSSSNIQIESHDYFERLNFLKLEAVFSQGAKTFDFESNTLELQRLNEDS